MKTENKPFKRISSKTHIVEPDNHISGYKEVPEYIPIGLLKDSSGNELDLVEIEGKWCTWQEFKFPVKPGKYSIRK